MVNIARFKKLEWKWLWLIKGASWHIPVGTLGNGEEFPGSCLRRYSNSKPSGTSQKSRRVGQLGQFVVCSLMKFVWKYGIHCFCQKLVKF
jgi:hypothetical protein